MSPLRFAMSPLTGRLAVLVVLLLLCPHTPADPLPGTHQLGWEGDLASRMLDGVDRFLLGKLEKSRARRTEQWQKLRSTPVAMEKVIASSRVRLADMIGVRDERVTFGAPELVVSVGGSALVGRNSRIEIFAIRWPVLADPDPQRDQVVVHGEGLLLVPRGREPVADVIALADADQTPEQICGLAGGVPLEAQFARRLAESGCRVVVPVLVSRENVDRGGRAKLTAREFIYRPAFELGRHIIGYEVQKVLSLVDWLGQRVPDSGMGTEIAARKLGLAGYGEGGMLALYAAALDPRIDALLVSGYFEPRESMWEQPIDRNVFGLLNEFGDAELAAMVCPRPIVIEGTTAPTLELASDGGAPARLDVPNQEALKREIQRIEELVPIGMRQLTAYLDGSSQDGESVFCGKQACGQFLTFLSEASSLADVVAEPLESRALLEPAARQKRQIDEMDQFTQLLLRESPFVRKAFMKELDTSSLEDFEKSIEAYRRTFRDEVIGAFEDEILPPKPRTRKTHETEKWAAYEVVLDVYPDVFAYGYLLLPKALKLDGSERRPVVVCQHGLEGRPTDTFLGDHRAYHDFAAKLAEQGFITFAPQNPYIFGDRFRTLQRKANPLGKTLFSVIVPQHQQIVDWLQTLPYVDPDRIGFYGLSYGGKTAMRVPAIVTDYCLSICSADFNEWVLKNSSTRHPFSYVWTGEYEIFEWDLGSAFNYAEMAALICPRPFMVERGHFDGVGWDEYVGYEFAKVRHLYQAQLGIGERCEIEWFAGPHTIDGEGTFEFLHRHLQWPEL